MNTSPTARKAIGLRLSQSQLYLVFGISAGVWLSGVVWLIYHYFMQIEGPFGFQKHPIEPLSLKVHGAFSFVSLWLFGTLWWTHVVRGWTANWRRWSGGSMVAAVAVLILSGWGLYYFVERNLREWTSLTHWVVGLASLGLFFIHWLLRSPRKSSAE